MFKEYNIINSYTLECSLCGPSIGARKEYHYSKKMLFVTYCICLTVQDMGKQFCAALIEFSDPGKCKIALKELQFKYAT